MSDPAPAPAVQSDWITAYTRPSLNAESVPEELRRAAQAALHLSDQAHGIVSYLQVVLSAEQAEIPLGADVASTVARGVGQLDQDYPTGCQLVGEVEYELMSAGGGFACGPYHARSAHDAALQYVRLVRRSLDDLVRLAGVPSAPDDPLSADCIRVHWDRVWPILRSVPDYFGNLPPINAIQPRVCVEMGLATEARRGRWRAEDQPEEPIRGGEGTSVVKGKKGKNIDAQMLKVMAENAESHGWSLREWAVHLNCARGTVGETKTWKERLKAARATRAADAACRMDRSRTAPRGRRRMKSL